MKYLSKMGNFYSLNKLDSRTWKTRLLFQFKSFSESRAVHAVHTIIAISRSFTNCYSENSDG